MEVVYLTIFARRSDDFEEQLNDAAEEKYEIVNVESGEFVFDESTSSYYHAVMKRTAPKDIQCPNCKTIFTAQNMSP